MDIILICSIFVIFVCYFMNSMITINWLYNETQIGIKTCIFLGFIWPPVFIIHLLIKIFRYLKINKVINSLEPQHEEQYTFIRAAGESSIPLLPCPFCGSNMVGPLVESSISTDKIGVVGCGLCGAFGPSNFDKEELLDRWNWRNGNPSN